jgi:hypothetical protein
MNRIRTTLLVAATALVSAGAYAAPQLPVRSPVISPVTASQPNPADYPLEITCKPKVSVDVVSNDVPAGWGSFGKIGEYEGSEVGKSIVDGKDEMHCNYFVQLHPDVRLTSLRFLAAKGSCIVNATKPGFRCKSGTVPSMK